MKETTKNYKMTRENRNSGIQTKSSHNTENAMSNYYRTLPIRVDSRHSKQPRAGSGVKGQSQQSRKQNRLS